MPEIEAIYEAGVFKPVGPVQLQEKQRVRLNIQPIPTPDFDAWWEQVQRVRSQIEQRVGVLPDSTPDIAEDRMRDV
jgi:predicted DNA-binding antitoxin AbrB/MazE fold protein